MPYRRAGRGGGGGGGSRALLERNWRQWLVYVNNSFVSGSAITTAATRRWIGHHRCDVPPEAPTGAVGFTAQRISIGELDGSDE